MAIEDIVFSQLKVDINVSSPIFRAMFEDSESDPGVTITETYTIEVSLDKLRQIHRSDALLIKVIKFEFIAAIFKRQKRNVQSPGNSRISFMRQDDLIKYDVGVNNVYVVSPNVYSIAAANEHSENVREFTSFTEEDEIMGVQCMLQNRESMNSYIRDSQAALPYIAKLKTKGHFQFEAMQHRVKYMHGCLMDEFVLTAKVRHPKFDLMIIK